MGSKAVKEVLLHFQREEIKCISPSVDKLLRLEEVTDVDRPIQTSIESITNTEVRNETNETIPSMEPVKFDVSLFV